MAQNLKALVALKRTGVQFPALTLENSQPPITNSSSRGNTAFLLASVQTYHHVVYIHAFRPAASSHIFYSNCTADSSIGLSTGSVYAHPTWNNPFLQSYRDTCPLNNSLSVL